MRFWPPKIYPKRVPSAAMNTLSGKLCVSSFANIKVIARFVLAFSFAICSLLALSESFADTAPLHHGDKQPRSTATFNKPVLTPAEHKWLNAHPVIRLGVDPSYAPYSEIDANGHLVGEVADYISIISRQLGIRFQISNPKQWAGILDAVKQHKIDVVATVVALPERKKYLSFTGIYIKTPLVLMTRSGDFSLRSPNDLAHRVVALVKGYSSTSQVLADHPDIKALLVKSPLQGLIAVATGEADAYVGAIGVNLAVDRQNGIANLRIATAYKLDNGQSFAVRDDWPILTRILDRALASIPDTTKASIESRWVPEQIPDNHSGLPVLGADEQRWIAGHRQIRVGLTESDEPNEFANNDGTPAGFVPEYLNLVSAITGLDIKIVRAKSRAELLSQLDAGLLDMVSVQTSPTHISDKHLFSVPFHITSVAVFARRDAAFIGGLSDLKGKRVALTPDLMEQTMLRRQPDIVLVTEPNPRAVLQAVLDGSADAGTLGVDTGQYLLEKYGFKQLRMVHVITGEETSLRFAVRPDSSELLEIVDQALAATTPEEAATIRRQVFNTAIDWALPREELILWVLIALAVVLAVFLLETYLGNKRLKAEAERRRLADASAASSEQRFRNFFKLGQTGMAITSPEQRWLNVNPRFCEMFGYSREELTGKTWVEMTHPDDIEANMALFRRLVSGEIEHYSMDKRFFHKNGDIVYAHLTVSSQHRPDRSVEYILATLEDITERKKFELSLRESEARLKLALSSANEATWDLEPPTGRLNFDSPWGAILGYANEEEKPHYLEDWAVMIHAEDRERVLKAIHDHIAGTTSEYMEEYRIRSHSGEWKWVAGHGKAVQRALDGKALRIVGVTRDINERKQAETALKDSEERYRKSFETSPDAVNITRLSDGRYLDVNRGFENMIGYRRDEVIGKTSLEMNIWRDPADRRRLVDSLNRTGVCDNLEADFSAKNGDVIRGLMSAVIINIKDEICIVTITRDITAHRELEKERERLLIEVRELSRRLIHIQEQERQAIALTLHDDIGQSLTAIKAYASSITHYCHLEDMDRVLLSANEINQISTGLLKTVRNQLRDLRPGYLKELGLKGALKNLCESWENSGAIACDLKITGAVDELPEDVQVQLFRIVQEGLTNVARHAAASATSVELSTGRHGLKLDIADDGRGFDPATTAHGIGLVGMRERAFAIGGLFDLQSAPGEGTQIHIRFQVDPDQEIL